MQQRRGPELPHAFLHRSIGWKGRAMTTEELVGRVRKFQQESEELTLATAKAESSLRTEAANINYLVYGTRTGEMAVQAVFGASRSVGSSSGAIRTMGKVCDEYVKVLLY